MGLFETILKRKAKNFVKKYRQRQLKPGEAGWGRPQPAPPAVSGVGRDKVKRAVIIGLGNQGIAQCQGIGMVPGIEIAAVAERTPERLEKVKKDFKLKPEQCFDDAEQMLKTVKDIDIVSIATTAPFHVSLGRLALESGAKNILLEKPMDINLKDCLQLQKECESRGVKLQVNYSRRWTIDSNAIHRAIERGFIGKPVSIAITIGRGELAMIASHYFDFCNLVFQTAPVSVTASLEDIKDVNRRGGDYTDPFGYCHFKYKEGQRAYFDFSSDMGPKDVQILIRGEKGYIFVDEPNMEWSLQAQGQAKWVVPFAEQMKSSIMFSRVIADAITYENPVRCSAEDGIKALEMILGAHMSSRGGAVPVSFPLVPEEAEIGVVFP